MPELTPDQAIEALRKLPPDKQRDALTRLSPDARRGIMSKLSSATPEQPKPPQSMTEKVDAFLAPRNESGIVGRLKNAARGAVSGVVEPLLHPESAVESLGASTMAFGTPYGAPAFAPTGNRARDEANEQAQSTAVSEQEASGREAAAHPAYTLGAMLGPAAVSHVAGAVAPSEEPASPGRLRRAAQNVIGIGEKPVTETVAKTAAKAAKSAEKVEKTNAGKLKKDAAARIETMRQNREAIKQHGADVADTKDENAKTVAAHQSRARVEQELNKASQELDEKYAHAESKAEADSNAAWAKTRAKTAGHETEVAPVKQTVEIASEIADPASSPVFRSILRTEAPDARPVYADHKPVLPGEPNYDRYYEMQYGEPPPLADEGGKIGFDRLQRWYSYISNQMYGGGRIDGHTYRALGLVRNSLNEAMGRIAKDAGAEEDLANARTLHSDRMETFSDSPNQAQTVATKALQETNPEHVKDQQRRERLEKVARYDPTIASLSKHVDNLRAGLKALPKEAPLREQVKQLPEKPELKKAPAPSELEQVKVPDADLKKIRKQMIEQAANRWRQTSQYQIRRLAASGIGGAIAAFTGHGSLEGASAGYLAAEFAPKVMASLVERPKVMEWLSKPSLEDIRALETVPDVDRVKIISGLTNEAVQEARSGKPPKISAQVAKFLGDANVKRIAQAAAPQTAGEAKKRAEATRASSGGSGNR